MAVEQAGDAFEARPAIGDRIALALEHDCF
jgi:hypothetical protein